MKSLVLGNGGMLVGLEQFGQIKDLYFDYVGLENHLTEEAVCKIGVWVEGQFAWLDNGEWEIGITYREETLASKIHAVNRRLELELDFLDLVYNEKNIFVRNITVHNVAKSKRTIKVFLNHQFRMYGVPKKDTVYFDPRDNTIVHYKGRRLALIGGKLGREKFSDYTVGLSNIEGKEGTWRDAEDGILSKNAIEHGTVDSTVAFEKTADADRGFGITYWICMGKTLAEVKELNSYVLFKTPEHLTESTEDYWRAWLNKTKIDFDGLSEEIISLFKKSLLIIRTHVDNTGGIIASGDSNMLQYGKDNYTYVWHRDGAFVAMALDMAGYHEVSRKFYEFSNDTLTEEGYFFHKYRSDKSLGSSWHGWITPDGKHRLPIQEDETALVISAIWQHYEYTKDLEFVEKIYNSLIKKASEFMLGFRTEKNLPSPSYDLWERVWGVHTFTAAAVYDALISASKFADLLGKEKDQERYSKGALEIKEAIVRNLYNSKTNFFYKFVDMENRELVHDETVDISSFYGVFRFGILDPENEILEKSFEVLKDKLLNKNGAGGIGRFEGDTYYQVGDATGNPWIVTTLWLSQYYIKKAKNRKDLEEAKKLIEWVVGCALPSGVLPEQVNPYTGEGMSATPLTWSHAEFVTTVILYLEKVRQLEKIN